MTDTYLTANIEGSDSQGRPENVPEKFWDAEKKEIRAQALLNSYAALEKKLSTMVPVPQTEGDRARLLKLLGVPDTPDGYQVTLPCDYLEVDSELNTRLHGKGFTPEQVQEVYNLAAEKFVPMILEMAAEFQAEREIERLVDAFGGVEKWRDISKQLQEFGSRSLPKPAFEGMACSYDGVMALYKMMQADAATPLQVRAESGDSSGLDEKSLRKMMQDPRYWRDRNSAFIEKVTKGFERLYGEK